MRVCYALLITLALSSSFYSVYQSGYLSRFHEDNNGALNRFFISQGVLNPDKCHDWAFGDDYNPFKAYLAWNKLHGTIVYIMPSDTVIGSYKKIANACVERGM